MFQCQNRYLFEIHVVMICFYILGFCSSPVGQLTFLGHWKAFLLLMLKAQGQKKQKFTILCLFYIIEGIHLGFFHFVCLFVFEKWFLLAFFLYTMWSLISVQQGLYKGLYSVQQVDYSQLTSKDTNSGILLMLDFLYIPTPISLSFVQIFHYPT